MPIEFAPPSPNLQGFQIPQPQYTDPLQTLAQLGQLRGQNLQRQQQQMELDSMRGALRAYAESGGDQDKFEALAPRYGVAPGVVVDFKTKIADLAAKRAQTQLAQTQTEKAAAEARDQEHDQLYQAYQPVWDAKPEEQQGLINNINSRLTSQGWDPKKLMQYTSPEDVRMAQNVYTTHKQIQLAADQQLKKAQQAKEEAETGKATTETQAAQRTQMINEIRAADQDPAQGVPTPAAWSAILQKYPKAGLPAQPTQQYISRLVESSVPAKDLPEYKINEWKAKVGLLGNSEFDQFLWQHARSLGKTPATLTPEDFNSGLQRYAEIKQDPILRNLAIATKGLQEQQTRATVASLPTPEAIHNNAVDLLNLDMGPQQFSELRSGRVSWAPQIIEEARKIAAERGTSFSMADLENRYKVREDTEQAFATGKEAGMVRSNNNALEHLDLLNQARIALGTGNIPMMRAAAQGLGLTFGSDLATTYDLIANRVGDEVTKSFVPGAGGEAERLAAAADFRRQLGDTQLKKNLQATVGLMDSQMRNLDYQYNEGTSNKGIRKGRLYSPDALAARERVLERSSKPSVPLKSGRTAYFNSQQEADRFKREHPDLVK